MEPLGGSGTPSEPCKHCVKPFFLSVRSIKCGNHLVSFLRSLHYRPQNILG